MERPTGRLILTRLAGVNAGILPETIGAWPAYRLWVDPSFAADLWEALAGIVGELGGRVVGTACLSAPSPEGSGRGGPG